MSRFADFWKKEKFMKLRLLLALPLVFQTLAVGQDPVKREQHEMHRLHQDSKAYIAMLENPKRDAYQKPHEVMTALNLKEGEVIADIGAGSGYFSLRIAHHVGNKGRVYAVDISPDMILHMNRKLRDLNLKNVVALLALPDDPLLADG